MFRSTTLSRFNSIAIGKLQITSFLSPFSQISYMSFDQMYVHCINYLPRYLQDESVQELAVTCNFWCGMLCVTVAAAATHIL